MKARWLSEMFVSRPTTILAPGKARAQPEVSWQREEEDMPAEVNGKGRGFRLGLHESRVTNHVLLVWFSFALDQLVVGGAAAQAAFFGGELEGFFAVEFGLADQFLDAIR